MSKGFVKSVNCKSLQTIALTAVLPPLSFIFNLCGGGGACGAPASSNRFNLDCIARYFGAMAGEDLVCMCRV